MASTKIIIRPKKVNKDGLCLIYILYTHWSKLAHFSTHEKVPPKFFNQQVGQVKKSYRGYTKINDVINQYRNKVESIRMNLILSEIDPTVDLVKKEYEKSKITKPTSKDFFDCEDEFLEYKKEVQGLAHGSMKHLRSFFNHMRKFSKTHFKVSFAKIDDSFYDELLNYFYEDLESSPNTVSCQIKMLKTYLSYCTKRGYNKNIEYTYFKKPSSQLEIIALSKEEMDQFFQYDLSSYPRLERVRDLFIMMCATGLRFSDLSNLSREHIYKDQINIRQKKTKALISIPLNQYSTHVLVKYNYELPRISNQNFNIYIREAGELAGLDNLREITRHKGRDQIVEKLPLHRLLRSHIGRKTFVSISLNQMSPRDVMAVTGHKDFGSFEKYVTASPKRLKEEINKLWKIKST